MSPQLANERIQLTSSLALFRNWVRSLIRYSVLSDMCHSAIQGVFIPVQLVNFAVVPAPMRLLVINVVSLFCKLSPHLILAIDNLSSTGSKPNKLPGQVELIFRTDCYLSYANGQANKVENVGLVEKVEEKLS